jgi:hypothetical protein
VGGTPSRGTILNARVVQCRDGALKPRQVPVQIRPRASWNVNRTSGPGPGANGCVPSGKWRNSTTFRHLHSKRARSSKRAGGLINRIALDECRVPERYRTRVPFYFGFLFSHLRARSSSSGLCHGRASTVTKKFSQCQLVKETNRRCARSCSPTAEARHRECRQCQCNPDHEHQPSLVELRLGEPFLACKH